jgi:hypothetical protein
MALILSNFCPHATLLDTLLRTLSQAVQNLAVCLRSMAIAPSSDYTASPWRFSRQLKSDHRGMLFAVVSATSVRLKDATGGVTSPKEDDWRSW